MGYTIPGREIPVYGTYDVCVVGGGTAGVIAALSAAREGLSVLIVEQFGSLGGSGTVGLVLPVMPTCMSSPSETTPYVTWRAASVCIMLTVL